MPGFYSCDCESCIDAREDYDEYNEFEGRTFTDTCKCESCKARDNMPNRVKPIRLASHSAIPMNGWVPRTKSHGDRNPAVYFGVELETSQVESRRDRREYGEALDIEFAAGCARPNGLWLAKHDGSVDGPEFASHPLTLDKWHTHERSLRAMFTELVHAGYRSHDGESAGMHVSANRSAFDSNAHVARAYFLGLQCKDEFTRLSQRTESQISDWCKFETARVSYYDALGRTQSECNMEFAQSVANNFVEDIDYHAGCDKYTWLHVFGRGSRGVEFRLPRGTLRVDRFFKNIEWLACIIEFTRSHADMSWSNFRSYAMEHEFDYPYLVNAIHEFGL
jgi:hypothetical protein